MSREPAGRRIGYARVSTTDQDVAGQVDELEAAGCVRIYDDTASGSLRSRPELDKALGALRAGDVLVVVRLDRLGRSLRHLIETVQQLADRGVGLVSLRESIDTTTSTGRLVLHIFGSLAEFERELIVERTQSGLAAARSRGRVGGRPPKLAGEKLATAQRMYDSKDHTIAAIARSLGISRATLYRHLTVPGAAGEQDGPATKTRTTRT